MSSEAWFEPGRLHPKVLNSFISFIVESLIYWRDVKKSGVVFGIGLAILLAMSMFSLISVFAYLSLLTLAGTISFRIYKTIMSAVQKTSEGHPFKEFLDIDLTLSPERVQQIAGVVVAHINAYIAELRRLFLVEDLIDSLKFASLLWLLTYIGAVFNGMSVIILSYVALFTLPKVYEANKQNIDQYWNLVQNKIMEISENLKGTADFLSHERAEKIDVQKPKVNVDDFLNFSDGFDDTKQHGGNSVLLPSVEKRDEKIDEMKSSQPEFEAQFKGMNEDYLNQYVAPNIPKNVKESFANDNFSSSEDLLSDFKDPTPVSPEIPIDIPKAVEMNKPPVAEQVKSVEKPKTAPPPAPTKKPTSQDTQIEAEKIFKNIGLVIRSRESLNSNDITHESSMIREKKIMDDSSTTKDSAEILNGLCKRPPILCSILSPNAWFKPDRLNPKVESLIYWRDVKKSGVVFGIGLAILLAMSMFSLISVFAYLSLLTLAGTISFRIYKTIMSAVQKTSEGHPFKEFLDIDLTLSPEKVQQIAGVVVAHINAYIAELRRLFLVEDLIDSLKFALLLWLLTYIGAVFNGMTVIILSYIAMFTLPKVYEANKQNIDQYLDLVKSKIMEITDKVKAAIPMCSDKKVESAKDNFETKSLENIRHESRENIKCFYVYECCKKIEFDCVQYCEPNYQCRNDVNNKLGPIESSEEIEETSADFFPSTYVIKVGACRRGFRRSFPIMDVKCILYLLFITVVSYVESQNLLLNSNEEIKCYYIYECCRKFQFECVEYCEPNYICDDSDQKHLLRLDEELLVTSTTSNPSVDEIETTTFQSAAKTNIIAVGVCRKGYRMIGSGKCKKVF
ncbi:CLUMA_CG001559, isoform A [Clunio marinus]|uniref:Reticulon-like protein n=1 Tax=Clunio marinus TaxID=568069 RepID=A0A1J1HJR9_9DIPT|nr:CLUMA_CG001559, isoform A [Clunio marinus]